MKSLVHSNNLMQTSVISKPRERWFKKKSGNVGRDQNMQVLQVLKKNVDFISDAAGSPWKFISGEIKLLIYVF